VSRLRPAVVVALVGSSLGCASSQAAEPPIATVSSASPPADATAPTNAAAHDGAELLGTQAHEWHVDHWMNSEPLTLGSLRGRVVLVRWFMSTRCPLCTATAPSLNAFDRDYRQRGLTVIGMYHHKDPEPLDPAKVAETVKTLGFTFPVAIDTDWRTLKDWWLDGPDRDFTSVSFLIDKKGTIRFIHPGGKYEPGSDGERNVRQHVEALLAE
jgi:peroxiredoxin